MDTKRLVLQVTLDACVQQFIVPEQTLAAQNGRRRNKV